MYQKNKKEKTVSSYYSFPWKPLHLREERKQRDLKVKSRGEAIILKTDRRAQKQLNTSIGKLKQGTCLAPHTWNLNWINCHRTSFDFDTNQSLLACCSCNGEEEKSQKKRKRGDEGDGSAEDVVPPLFCHLFLQLLLVSAAFINELYWIHHPWGHVIHPRRWPPILIMWVSVYY